MNDTSSKDKADRYRAGVMKYAEMGYWDPTTSRRTPM
jgi:hypothetical protein